jgi:hypothetical protein
MEAKTEERLVVALEAIVEKLGNLEGKLEELSYEVQSQGTLICEALSPTLQECDN